MPIARRMGFQARPSSSQHCSCSACCWSIATKGAVCRWTSSAAEESFVETWWKHSAAVWRHSNMRASSSSACARCFAERASHRSASSSASCHSSISATTSLSVTVRDDFRWRNALRRRSASASETGSATEVFGERGIMSSMRYGGQPKFCGVQRPKNDVGRFSFASREMVKQSLCSKSQPGHRVCVPYCGS